MLSAAVIKGWLKLREVKNAVFVCNKDHLVSA